MKQNKNNFLKAIKLLKTENILIFYPQGLIF